MSPERVKYLKQLAIDYDVPLLTVVEVALLLGEEEDFDGLPAMLDDYKYIS